ncbi:glycoprotein 3-alpha-L-fucosyltransferase A-like [Lycorma delicatula]|uniref:glycoprotein 3-alpha-L-fucosyltransferase A-like n=1 Tax=Lycorma delicatula TaxID=130591 RepID=UPI003F51501A
MLPRRFYLRRCFLYLLGLTCFLFLIINFRQNAVNDHVLFRDRQKRPDAPTSPDSHTPQEVLPLQQNLVFVPTKSEAEEPQPQQQKQIRPPPQPHEQVGQNQKHDRSRKPAESVTVNKIDADSRPWFVTGGKRLPVAAKISRKTGRRIARLWPQEEPGSDRIPNQLMFYPPNRGRPLPMKKILIFHGLNSWGVKPGQEAFKHCPVDSCVLTANKAESLDADAILFKDHFVHPGHHRPNRQVWIIYFLECPYHTQHIKYNDVFNWTATYRRDSDIVAPYERWMYYNDSQMEYPGPLRDFVGNKTDKVAWFVSNCGARNSRLQFAHELAKHIQVDIYGACGKLKCPRSIADKCFEMLTTKYKFYLAFENSNCKDYITEKLFVNGLGHNVLPIVMGAPPEDYYKSAPRHSFIHVDDFESPKELAAYLLKLDADNDLYNSYFKWKGMGEFLNTHFFCRLCSLLHDDNFPIKSYRDINEWWRGPGICTTGSWRKANKNWSLDNKINYETSP